MFWSLFSNLLTPAPFFDFISSPVWTFLGGVGAIVAIPIALIPVFLTSRQQQNRRELSYQIVSNAPIVSVNKALEKRVEVLLDKKAVKGARLLVIKVWNSSQLSIKPTDYVDPVKFIFNNGTVISSEVLKTDPLNLLEPQDIKTFIKSSNASIELSKLHLNPQDTITFTVLLSGKSDIEIRGKLDQGQVINYREQTSKRIVTLRKYAIALTATNVIITTIQLILVNYTNNSSISIVFQPFILIVVIAYILIYRRRLNLIKSLSKEKKIKN